MVFIAVLPFFSVARGPLGASLPLIMFGVIGLVVFFRVLVSARLYRVFTTLDSLILFYLIISSVSLLVTWSETGFFALVKSTAYFFMYLGLKTHLSGYSYKDIMVSTVYGVTGGTVLFLAAVAIAIFVLMAKGFDFSEGIGYDSLTLPVARSISGFLGGEDIERSSDFMRNVMGEVFAFYIIVLLSGGTRPGLRSISVVVVNTVFMLATVSRRAFIAVSASLVLLMSKYIDFRRSAAMGVGGILILLVTVLAYYSFHDNLRVFDISDSSRIQQYEQALSLIYEKPILGWGYGAKLGEGVYVHNFVLASAYMNGIPGLVLGLSIYFLLVIRYLSGVISSPGSGYHMLLVIPILGLSVGSTVEGIFTIIGWLCIALYDFPRLTGNSPMCRA